MALVLVLIIGVVLFAVFWRIDDQVELEDATPDPASEPDLVAHDIAAGERLRREAANTTDPEERDRLLRLAAEADGDVDQIRHIFEDNR